MSESAQEYVAHLIANARAAQKKIEYAGQAEVDNIVARIARAGTTEAFAQEIAEQPVCSKRISWRMSSFAVAKCNASSWFFTLLQPTTPTTPRMRPSAIALLSGR